MDGHAQSWQMMKTDAAKTDATARVPPGNVKERYPDASTALLARLFLVPVRVRVHAHALLFAKPVSSLAYPCAHCHNPRKARFLDLAKGSAGKALGMYYLAEFIRHAPPCRLIGPVAPFSLTTTSHPSPMSQSILHTPLDMVGRRNTKYPA